MQMMSLSGLIVMSIIKSERFADENIVGGASGMVFPSLFMDVFSKNPSSFVFAYFSFF